MRMSSEFENKHYHWEFIGYDHSVPETGQMFGSTRIVVIGYDNQENALIAAKELVPKPHYHLNSVFECNTCKFQSSIVKMNERIQ